MKAIVTAAICPLMSEPHTHCERADEALSGMIVELLEEVGGGWYQVETHYGYIGYAAGDCLLVGDEAAGQWATLEKRVVLAGCCDVLAQPRVESWILAELVRGDLVAPVEGPDEKGWQKVLLSDGREGFTKISFLGHYYDRPAYDDEEALRAAVLRSALAYRGSHYRWGGKTPLGIDCSGLCSMAYLLNGVLIWRDAHIKEGYPLHPIELRDIKPADLIFFPGHVAMYLGEGRYLHSTAHPGDDGVTVNSLSPQHSDYRADLAEKITAVGSIF